MPRRVERGQRRPRFMETVVSPGSMAPVHRFDAGIESVDRPRIWALPSPASNFQVRPNRWVSAEPDPTFKRSGQLSQVVNRGVPAPRRE